MANDSLTLVALGLNFIIFGAGIGVVIALRDIAEAIRELKEGDRDPR